MERGVEQIYLLFLYYLLVTCAGMFISHLYLISQINLIDIDYGLFAFGLSMGAFVGFFICMLTSPYLFKKYPLLTNLEKNNYGKTLFKLCILTSFFIGLLTAASLLYYISVSFGLSILKDITYQTLLDVYITAPFFLITIPLAIMVGCIIYKLIREVLKW
ncbi:MAG: hypothetical protein Q4P17_03955 [Methanobacterium sp.]|nr:hypothetical protein [Methanobacterium sp.]